MPIMRMPVKKNGGQKLMNRRTVRELSGCVIVLSPFPSTERVPDKRMR
jgi:hypothetical protein